MPSLLTHYNRLNRKDLAPPFTRYIVDRGVKVTKIHELLGAASEDNPLGLKSPRYNKMRFVGIGDEDDQVKPRDKDFDRLLMLYPEFVIPFFKSEFGKDLSILQPFINIVAEHLKGNDKPLKCFDDSFQAIGVDVAFKL